MSRHRRLVEGTTAGVIESHEHAMVRNVLRLDDREIGSLMVPRGDVKIRESWDGYGCACDVGRGPQAHAQRP